MKIAIYLLLFSLTTARATAEQRAYEEALELTKIISQRPRVDEKGEHYYWELTLTNGSRFPIKDILITTVTYNTSGTQTGVYQGTIYGTCEPFATLSVTNFEIRNVPDQVESFDCKLDGLMIVQDNVAERSAESLVESVPAGKPEPAQPKLETFQPDAELPGPFLVDENLDATRVTSDVSAPARPVGPERVAPPLVRPDRKSAKRQAQLAALEKEQQRLTQLIAVKHTAKQPCVAEDRRLASVANQIKALQAKSSAEEASRLVVQQGGE